jgi:hypothetical protein
MKSIRDSLYELIQNESIKSELKMIFKPFAFMIYNELYFYLLMILVYCGLLLFFVLGSFFYLVSIHNKLKRLTIEANTEQ